MDTIINLTKCCLQELHKIGTEGKNGNIIVSQNSKLIFPQKRDRNKRISEQEVRFLFVKELEKQRDYFYSIETPTSKCYGDFSPPKEPKIKNDGRSGNIDLVLYKIEMNDFRRKHLIEFKHGNDDSCKKDFLKLLCDDKYTEINYYINTLEKCNNKTMTSLLEKYHKAIEYIFNEYQSDICSKIIIVICFIGSIAPEVKDTYGIKNNKVIIYEVDGNNKNLNQIKED